MLAEGELPESFSFKFQRISCIDLVEIAQARYPYGDSEMFSGIDCATLKHGWLAILTLLILTI